jgi:penicillin-binding protein 1A
MMTRSTLKAPKRPLQVKKKTNKKTIKSKKGILSKLFRVILMVGLWCFMIGGFVLFWLFQELPDINTLKTAGRRPSVIIQASDGTILSTYGDLREDVLRVKDLPPHLPQALMAVEDNRFYSHFGVDIIGLLRAMYSNYKAGRVVQGGSTITQQLAKNFLLTQKLFPVTDRSIKRKIQEVLLAFWLEWHFTKDQIMSIYLNRVYFGSGTYGIDAAAERFFQKSARHLTVFESALIAGLLQAPSRYSPAANPERSKKRAISVMAKMKDLGYIGDYTTYLAEGSKQLEAIKSREEKSYRYFTDWIYESIPDHIGGLTKDVVVTTTLDINAQNHAEFVLKYYVDTLGKELSASQAAMIAMRTDGAVVAMLGGRSYSKSQFNRATQALRQPGSSFKPFIYLTGLENGFTPDSMFEDAPQKIGSWEAKNYKYKSQGEITMAWGLIKSVNAVSIRVCQAVTPEKVIDLSHRFGFSSDMLPTLSIALGTMEVTLLELVSAFAVFSNEGKPVYAYGIEEIRDKAGNILYTRKPLKSRPIVKKEPLSQIREMLQRVVREGTGRRIYLDDTMMGKTGSNDNKDAYFIGYRGGTFNDETIENGIHDVAFGVWVGNDDMKLMHKTSLGSNMPLKIAKAFLMGKIPPEDMEKPIVDHPKNKQKDNRSAKPLLPQTPINKTVEHNVGKIVTIDDLLD